MKLKHGLYKDPITGKKSRLYHIWEDMKSRCNNPNNKRYKDYGGRGIVVCEFWASNYFNFHQWAYLHGYSDELTIDRLNTDGNYEPGNCKWSTPKMQGNNRRTCVLITYNGETRTQTEWAEIIGAGVHLIKQRLKRGWTIERALTTKVR